MAQIWSESAAADPSTSPTSDLAADPSTSLAFDLAALKFMCYVERAALHSPWSLLSPTAMARAARAARTQAMLNLYTVTNSFPCQGRRAMTSATVSSVVVDCSSTEVDIVTT